MRNMLNLIFCRRTVVAVGIALFSGSTLADSRPADAYAPMQIPAPPYRLTSWNYPVPAKANAVPTIDRAGTYYLPYLPWMGDNLALLVNYANFFYQQAKGDLAGNTAYDAPVTALANIALTQTLPQTQEAAAKTTGDDVNQDLSSDPLTGFKLRRDLLNVQGTDTMQPCKSPLDTVCVKNQQDANSAFNADTLMGTMGYAQDKANAVNNLVSFMSSRIDPLPPLNPNNLNMNNLNVQKYILQARAMAAAQSLALSNFNYLAQEREIVPGLGEKAGMTTLPTDNNAQPIKDASQLQLEEFLINRRLGNEAWYTAVNTAPSIAIQRDSLFVLAGLQQQLFQLRLLNERMLATLSAMEMQMMQFNKANMLVLQQNIMSQEQKK